MKRILALILMLCLLLGALPMQALAYVGDIFPASGTVKKPVYLSHWLANARCATGRDNCAASATATRSNFTDTDLTANYSNRV